MFQRYSVSTAASASPLLLLLLLLLGPLYDMTATSVCTDWELTQVGLWMRDKLTAHPCFEPVPEEEIKSDPAAQLLVQATEEGQKVARNSGQVGQQDTAWPA